MYMYTDAPLLWTLEFPSYLFLMLTKNSFQLLWFVGIIFSASHGLLPWSFTLSSLTFSKYYFSWISRMWMTHSDKVIICFLLKAIFKAPLLTSPLTPSQKPWKGHSKYITDTMLKRNQWSMNKLWIVTEGNVYDSAQ